MEKLIDAVRVLSVEIGPRGSASEAERRAAKYAAERLRRAGFEVKIEPFRGLTTFSLPYGLIYSGFVLAAPLHLLSPAASFALALLSTKLTHPSSRFILTQKKPLVQGERKL